MPGLPTDEIYLEPDRDYSILVSAADSVRFTMARCLTEYNGHACATSSFVDETGATMEWHDFGLIEGPGWAANAVGGAYELIRWARFARAQEIERKALSVLDHVLEDGFIDPATGLIYGYRKTDTDGRFLNYERTNEYFGPGSMARIACQMLWAADLIPGDSRADRLTDAAKGVMGWIDDHLRDAPNGWFPRRCKPNGEHYRPDDPIFDHSGDGLFILDLMREHTERGMHDYTTALRAKLDVFARAGGMYGSINHDTYDSHESVSYAVAFRALLRCARLLVDPSLRDLAYSSALAGLAGFQMAEDRNGVATKGLLWMEKSWDTAYLWENAEASLAFIDAALDRASEGERSTAYQRTAVTILRAAAKHHYGPYGFLTEGVDWNNHVGRQHHFDQAEFGAIRYTEPFLNNLHIVEPTLRYVDHFDPGHDVERWG